MALTGPARGERSRSAWLVLVSPRRAFIRVREHPRPWIALLVVCVFALAPPLAFLASVDFDAFMMRELKASGQLEEIPPEAMEVITTKVIPGMRFALPIGAAGKRALWCFAIGVIGFALLRGTRKELRLGQCVAALAVSVAPLVLHDLLGTLVYALRDVNQYDVRNPVLSNPAVWLGLHVENDPVGILLHGLDLFMLWAVWLAGLGLATVSQAKGAMPWIVPISAHVLFVGGRAVSAMAGSAAMSAAGG
jgi:hypothetical protein